MIFYIFLVLLVVVSLITGLIITIIEKRSISIDECVEDVQQENTENNVGEEKIEEKTNENLEEEIEVLDIFDSEDDKFNNNVQNNISDVDDIDII